MEEISFNAEKAKELINFLLINDINIYKKLIPEINCLNSEDIEMLFNGEIDYDYNIKNKKILKKLLDKFDNFQVVLEEWYKNKKYYEYLKMLWIKYPCIEDLKEKNMEELEKIMDSYSIDFRNWPEEIKNEFKELINQTSDTRAYELKKEIDNKYCQISAVLKELAVIKNESKNWGKQGNLLSMNASNLLTNIIQTICIPIGMYTLGKSWYNKVIQEKEQKSLRKLICKEFVCEQKDGEQICKKFVKYIEEKDLSGSRHFTYTQKNGIKKELDLTCDKGKLDNLEPFKKAKTFFKSKLVCGLHAGLSFINLCWSIYELNQTYKDAEIIKKYTKRLDDIIKAFESHQELIGVIPDDFEKAISHIKYILSLIAEDQRKLSILIEDILKRLEFQNSQKDKSVKGIFASIGLGIFGVAGACLTGGGTAIVYGVSTLSNILSLAIHAKNISESTKYINQYHALLKKAMNEQKRMQKQYEDLVERLMNMINEEKDKLEEEPKFNLYSSMSSISTNF
jgi:tetratricopeptide (TPR) repeat protein